MKAKFDCLDYHLFIDETEFEKLKKFFLDAPLKDWREQEYLGTKIILMTGETKHPDGIDLLINPVNAIDFRNMQNITVVLSETVYNRLRENRIVVTTYLDTENKVRIVLQ